ncbi:GerAB/ArcD/ProY family transporter [Paenibacillus sp. FSL H8-0034]|uniref:GerAB/ArcD/ProY family transporter n=1 Tax=Paenibacillus sp. FSL H8-0034 TaxID=2954671 RepID=UPI0030F53943
MAKIERISILQASFIIITMLGILDHVILLPALLRSAGRDAWVSVLVAGLLFLCWIPFVFYIMDQSKQEHLFIWLKRRLGVPIAWMIIMIIIFQLFVMCIMTIKDVTYWSNITYLPDTPNVVIVSSLVLVSFYAVYSGIRTIAIVNGILFPFVILLGIFVATANFPHKNYSLLFPLLEYGFEPAIKGVMYAGSGLTGILFFVYIQHRLQSKMSLRSLLWVGIVLVGLTLGPLMGAIAIFGPFEAARMRFPAYEEWRLVTFGHFLEHIDFFSIYQWLVGSFTRISIGIFLIPDLLDVQRGKRRTVLLVLLFAIMIIGSQIQINDRTFVEFLTTMYLPYSLLLSLILSVLFVSVAWIFGKRRMEI